MAENEYHADKFNVKRFSANLANTPNPHQIKFLALEMAQLGKPFQKDFSKLCFYTD
jgi:hypothetical protein